MSNLLRTRLVPRAAPWLLAAALVSAAGCPVVHAPGNPAAGGGAKAVVADTNPTAKGVTTGPETSPLDVPPPPPPTNKRFALLVGVKNYDSPDLPDLNYSEADVEDLASALHESGYADDDVVLMTRTRADAQKNQSLSPTAANIRDQLDALLKRAGKDDVVVVGLSGHGIQPKDGKQYFCAYQADVSEAQGANPQPKTLVPIDEVYQKLGDSPAALKLLLVDACRNDPFAKGAKRREVDDFKSVTLGPLRAGVIALYSCSQGQHSYESPELRHGVFFHYLIEGLQGHADMHQDGRITYMELADYVKGAVDLYAKSRLNQLQQVYFTVESNVNEPLAVLAKGHKAPPKPMVEGVLVDEDFRNVPLGGPPKDWDGDGFRVVKDADGRACLEVQRKEGEQKIELPRMALTGDFYVEVETLLDGRPGWDGGHYLRIELEGKSGAVLVPVFVDHLGLVTVQNSQTVKVENFTPYKRARVRLTREGNRLYVTLNGEVRSGVPLDYTGLFDTVRLGLTAGIPYHNTLGITAKIYSVKIGLLNNGRRIDLDTERVLLKEDFKQAGLGGQPTGWTGDGFSVGHDKNGRACLEVNKKEEWQAIELPRVALTGDFYVEVETLLDGSPGWNGGHSLCVELDARGGAVRVPIWVDHLGVVTVGYGGLGRKPDGYQPYQITRIRVAREGKNLQVSLDGQATGVPLDYTGDFDTVRLGLAAGIPYHNTLGITAKIYSVKIGLPGDGPIPPPPPPLPDGVREDFSKASVGGLPDGWAAGTPARILSVQQTGEHKDLELTNPAAGGDFVRLPQKNLNGNYYLEFAAEFPSEDSWVAFQLVGGKKTPPFPIQLDGHGKLNGGPAQTAFLDHGRQNVLGVEHNDKGYFVKLNEVQIASLPPAAGLGPYDTVVFMIGVTAKDQKSPHVNSVRVQPLP